MRVALYPGSPQTRRHAAAFPRPAAMIKELDPIVAVLSFPNSAPEDTARALIDLSRLLYPEKNASFRQSVLKSAQIFARALELVAALGAEAEGEALAQCLIAIARWAYVSGQPLKGLPPAQRAVDVLSRLGPRPLLPSALTVHAALLMDAGNLPRAIETFAAALETAVELGDQIAEGAVLNNLG